ncbi:Insulin-degrading enzyme [Hondaea fermentalgiana]|uniref:Insulin-degrading enzyme n=1 Tax=Hondaea fermentalgiana TaxID=2315210 RepID=A0A2R5GNN6_9STRA|nr:Insulin-degrading enzyme [Hondaea fermentalgiana]|eukprot:GBG32235.1 Insulin-degrading enzyme [Hondaea fermentalgiana]
MAAASTCGRVLQVLVLEGTFGSSTPSNAESRILAEVYLSDPHYMTSNDNSSNNTDDNNKADGSRETGTLTLDLIASRGLFVERVCENDRKEYRLVRLENGLECVLVSAEKDGSPPGGAVRKVQEGDLGFEAEVEQGPGAAAQKEAHKHRSSRRTSLLSKRASLCSRHSHASSVISSASHAPHAPHASLAGAKRASQRRASALVRPPRHQNEAGIATQASDLDAWHPCEGVPEEEPLLVAEEVALHDADTNPSTVKMPGAPDMDIKSNRIAYVSMAVGVGSFSEPDECPGLAHFVEHMLFMGSSKYPRENEFDVFLSQNGGANNAYTDTERTVYFFSCFQKELYKALDIFAQFFIDPLMLEEAAERELDAIESEFSIRSNMDDCRHLEIWRDTSRPGTPFARFTCGSEESLRTQPSQNGIDVHAELRKFHDRYYVAPNMRLAIVGHTGLDELEEAVRELFADVRHGRDDPLVTITPTIKGQGAPWRMGAHRADVARRLRDEGISELILEPDLQGSPRSNALPKPGIDGHALGCVFGFAPISDSQSLTITWQIPAQHEHYKTFSADYIAHLLGHESRGSILAELKSLGWATGLDCGCSSEINGFEHNTSSSVVLIQVRLTMQGLINWIFVAGIIYEYIGMLQRKGPQKWIYEEQSALEAMTYRFKEDEDYADVAEELSVRMLQQNGLDTDWILDPSSRLEWDPDQVETILNHLRPELARVDLQSSLWGPERKLLSPRMESRTAPLRRVYDSDVIVRIDQYTQTRYWARFLPQDVIDLWNSLLDGSQTIARVESDANDGEKKGVSKNENTTEPSNFDLDEGQVESSKPPLKGMFDDQLERGCIRDRTAVHASILQLPERNPFIPNDFSLLGASERLKMNEDEQGLLWGTQVVISECKPVRRHVSAKLRDTLTWNNLLVDGISDPQVVLTESELLRGPVEERPETQRGTVIYHDITRMRILVDYGSGLLAWHQLLGDGWAAGQKRVEVDTPGLELRIAGTASPMTEMTSASRRVQSSAAFAGFGRRRRPLHAFVPSFTSSSSSAAAQDKIAESIIEDIWSGFPSLDEAHLASVAPALVRVHLDESGAQGGGFMSGLRLWYSSNSATRVPRTEVNVRLICPLLSAQPVFVVLADLLAQLWTEAVLNESFLASLAGLDVSISSNDEGLNLNVSGITDRILSLLDTVFAMLASIAATSRKYGLQGEGDEASEDMKPLYGLIPRAVCYAQRAHLLQTYENEASHFTSEGPVSSAMYKVLVNGSWRPETLLKATMLVKFSEVADFAALLLRRSNVDACVSGNVDASMAEESYRILAKHLKPFSHKGLPETNLPEVNALKVPVARVNPNKSDIWSAVTGLVHPLEAIEFVGHSADLYFQLGPDTLEVRLLAEVIELLIKEPIFAVLRTQLQLGYMVQASVVSVRGVLGMLVEVTSNKFTPPEIAMYVDDFLADFYKGLAEMDIEDFHKNVCALARSKLEEERSIRQQADRLWDAISLQPFRSPATFEWKSNVQEIEYLRHSLSRKSVLAAFARWLLPSSPHRRRISVLVFGVGYEKDCVEEIMARSKYISMIDSDFIYKSTASCMPSLTRACIPPIEAQDKRKQNQSQTLKKKKQANGGSSRHTGGGDTADKTRPARSGKPCVVM